MPWTFDDALADDLIQVTGRDDHAGYYSIKLAKIETLIGIELGRAMDSDETRYRLSHAIHTPAQAGRYPGGPVGYADYPAYALHRAMDALTSHYREAVRLNHLPSETWLVPFA